MQARKNAALLSLDADGTFYGTVYKVMLLTLALDYRSQFLRLAPLNQPYSVDEELDLEKTLKTINEYLDDPSVPEACLSVPSRHYEREAILRAEFVAAFKQVAPDTYAKLLYVANRELIDKLVSEIPGWELDHLFLAIGSLRQTEAIDQHNCHYHGTASIFEDIYILESIFKAKLPSTIAIEIFPFTIMDAMNNLAVGSSLQAIANGVSVASGLRRELTKLPLHYALIHGACVLLKTKGIADCNLVYVFIDDMDYLHDFALQTFSRYSHLLPEQATFVCRHVVEGKMRQKKIGTNFALQGTGEVDALFLLSTQSLQVRLAKHQHYLAVDHLPLTQKDINSVFKHFQAVTTSLDEMGLFVSQEPNVNGSTPERKLSFL